MKLNIETAQISDSSKALLRKLAAAGFVEAGVDYVIGPEIASANDFQEIVKSTYQVGLPILETFQAPNAGQDAGKIRLKFAFELA